MGTGWLRSLHCNSNALDDVVVYSRTPSSSSSLAKKPILSSVSCGNDSHAVKDVCLLPKYPSSTPRPKTKSKQRPVRPPHSPAAGPRSLALPFPTLEDLPAGQSSRRVVEIIFASSWSFSGEGAAAFPGEIEMLFRVHNPARTVARFEECRAAARARAADARCAADGNEMLRFHCGGGGSGLVYNAGVVRSAVWSAGKKVSGVRTFSSSGIAHTSGGGAAGRRGMLVCRVVAGLISSESENESSEAESVSLECGELLVFDHRAVLPCFLIIYTL
ncbi:uncharacterized protein LOC122050447 [Zingiber officinale]|uniref:Uncharacterized protein n=1 Tax=Zingiber officinale TaxID=94328 RepID=A0A8J5LLZ7_ZINOF|nr:uncharacterized protein LOC122050447 [Zingiber officinale]KAG6521189.1 hypothetical protein ZIOFF_018255 [Zingiber officinale]